MLIFWFKTHLPSDFASCRRRGEPKHARLSQLCSVRPLKRSIKLVRTQCGRPTHPHVLVSQVRVTCWRKTIKIRKNIGKINENHWFLLQNLDILLQNAPWAPTNCDEPVEPSKRMRESSRGREVVGSRRRHPRALGMTIYWTLQKLIFLVISYFLWWFSSFI